MQVTPYVIINRSNELKILIAEHRATVAKIDKWVEQIGIFDDEYTRGLINKYNDEKITFRRIDELLEEYAKYMEVSAKLAKEWQENDSHISDMFQ